MAAHQVRRSGLTMPVVTRRFVDHAWRRGCDFINLDLEDSVPQHLKAHARTLIKDAIPVVRKGGAEAFTRINHDYVHADLEAFGSTRLSHRLHQGGLPPFFLAPTPPERDFQEWLDAYWAKDILELFRLERRQAFQKLF